jgi:hypothetical protein
MKRGLTGGALLRMVPDPFIPEGLVSWLIKRQLRDGARGLIHALGREAGLRG